MTPSTPRWAVWGSVVCASFGVADSVYLSYEHLTASTTLACSETGIVNCLKVTTSAYSRVAGIPIAFLGVAYFVMMLGLCLPAAWRTKALTPVRIAGAAVGALFAVYLVWAELFRLDAICLWCSAAHVAAVALFGLVVLGSALARAPFGANQ